MEYVILAVLIAAACVVAVYTFGRAVVTGMLVASDGATLQHTEAHSELVQQREYRKQDIQDAKEYHDSMHQ